MTYVIFGICKPEGIIVNMPGSTYFPNIKYVSILKYDGSGHFCLYNKDDLK
jgi:hypothetical protein